MKYYNKINRNFDYKARLYFNGESYNRASDITPRFWVELVELNSVERVGFTEEGAEANDYSKYANRFYGKDEGTLTDSEIESLSNEIKKTTPYGYSSGTAGSQERYLDDVKYNPSYQSFYKKYWDDHAGDIKQASPHPYINISSINEIVNTKHSVDSSATKVVDVAGPDTFHYSAESQYTCLNNEIQVSFSGNDLTGAPAFYVNGEHRETLFIGRNNKYVFTMVEPWVDSFTIHGTQHPFRVSRMWDGIWERGHSLLSGVQISGAGHSPGTVGNKVVLVTDENTPNTLYYYSPLDEDAGGIISVHDNCDGNVNIALSELEPESDWHLTSRFDWATGYYLNKSSISDHDRIHTSGVPDHSTADAERGWFSFPNSDVANSISGSPRSYDIPQDPTIVASRTGAHLTPNGAVGVSLNGMPFFNSSKALTEGSTSSKVSHSHTYSNIDSNGNGWTDWHVNTSDTTLKHRHQVVNWVVDEAFEEGGVSSHFHSLEVKDLSKNLYVDSCNGRPDGNGIYHYYKNPTCTYTELSGEHSPIVGYAFDGYPIYGTRDHSGILVTSAYLDEHHGHYDETRGWHYHASSDFPHVVGTHYKGVPRKTNYLSSNE